MRRLKVGLIGCGSFARNMHVPNLRKNPKYAIYALVDVDAEAATSLGVEVGAAYATTDIRQVLEDKKVDVVFITTRHDSHANLSTRAAEAGKHIFCEKPMGLTAEECRQVAGTVRKHGVKYTVGYNRGLSPLIARARELLHSVRGKKMIYHRIQTLFPETHWTHDPAIGGGRFVGEGCHIFDLFCELIEAAPISVYASGGIFLNPAVVKIPDSSIVTLAFADGSIAATLIASAGCSLLPKEFTEIYCDKRGIFIDDFKSMQWGGFGSKTVERYDLPAVDKGQAVEIDLLADAILNDRPPPNGIVNAARAAIISFKVNESIRNKTPVPIFESDYKW